jgi:hypothetical protein
MPISRPVRVFLTIAVVSVFLVALPLLFLSEHTDRYFAWTIKPPITAAFLGSGYGAVALALWLALREREWVRIRAGVWVITTGLTLILIATLAHLDRFHLHSAHASLRVWAWTWLVLYGVLGPALLVALWMQWRTQGTEPPVQMPLPGTLRVALRLLGAVMLSIGVALFVAPGTAETIWAWPLSPLTSRMVGSWFASIGLSLFVAARENDYQRVRVVAAAYAAYPALQVITLGRWPEAVDATTPQVWLLAVVLVCLFALGTICLLGARKPILATPANR